MTRSSESRIPARHRNRASAACTACRKGRIRCVVDSETRICSHCRDNGHDCIFDEKDGRKSRASAKAVASVLSQRIQILEQRLGEQQAQNEVERVAMVNSFALDMTSVSNHGDQPPPYDAVSLTTEADAGTIVVSTDAGSSPGQSDRVPDAEETSALMRKIIPLPMKFDMATGRTRYFGPTANMNVLSGEHGGAANGMCTPLSNTRGSAGLVTAAGGEHCGTHWPICLIVRDVLPETHNYLMDLFWACHNSVVHLVHLDAFYHDQDRGGTQFYSTFLHMAILAIGFRYADKSRGDIQRLTVAGQGNGAISTLHEKVRAMAKLEMDRPGGIPAIQAFQLLGDMEFYSGRDDTGWLYVGMSIRMIFDTGLHADPSLLKLTERETQIRHMTLWASLVTDKFWSLYLGRPTTLKTSDISPACLSFDFGRLVACRPSGHEKKVGTRIYEALLRLMELVSRLCSEVPRPPPPTLTPEHQSASASSTEAYFKMAAMGQELKSWYSGLPEDLKWPSEKQSTMPPSYFLLHTAYHTSLILLHRPFVPYCDPLASIPVTASTSSRKFDPSSTTDNYSGADSDAPIRSHFIALSRSVCADSARRTVAVLQRYGSHFDPAQAFGTAVQHAGIAASALMGEVLLQKHSSKPRSRASPEVERLINADVVYLRQVLGVMSRNYQPAAVMASSIDEFLSVLQTSVLEVPIASPCTTTQQIDSYATYSEVIPGHMRKRVTLSNSILTSPVPSPVPSPLPPAPGGLPYLPSSFLERLGADESAFAELGGHADYDLPWDLTSSLGLP